jgi:hypothetical protein
VKPRTDPSKKLKVMKVTGVSPTAVAIGDKVTVTGQNLDRTAALLLGKVSPLIVEKTPTKLVFVAPRDPDTKMFSAKLFLLVPGQRVLASSYEITIGARPKSKAAVEATAAVSVDEDGQLSKDREKRYEVELGDASAVRVQLRATGGEVEARLEDGNAAHTDTRATYGGTLAYEIERARFGDAKKVAFVLATDAKDLKYHAKIELVPPVAAASEKAQ